MPDLKKMYVARRKIFLVKPSMPEKKRNEIEQDNETCETNGHILTIIF